MKYIAVFGLKNLGWTEDIDVEPRPGDFFYFDTSLYQVESIHNLTGEVGSGHKVIKFGAFYADVES